MLNWNHLPVTIDPVLENALTQWGQRVEKSLSRYLPGETTQPRLLHSAMRYAALGGGKYIRPVLVYTTGKVLDVAPENLDAPACAVELIHAYSLVHDDLPAMDDDDLRRGRATCHKAYDEATAILVGDALQSLAFQILAQQKGTSTDSATRLQMISILARASGSRGMAGGQALDIEATGKDMDLPQLENMHIHKTGALIRASVQLGALAAAASGTELERLDRYAKYMGLAFQVQDDILDVAGETAVLGKTQGKDAAAEKPTYPQLLGLDGAREKAGELLADALDALSGFDEKADPLRRVAQYIVHRNR